MWWSASRSRPTTSSSKPWSRSRTRTRSTSPCMRPSAGRKIPTIGGKRSAPRTAPTISTPISCRSRKRNARISERAGDCPRKQASSTVTLAAAASFDPAVAFHLRMGPRNDARHRKLPEHDPEKWNRFSYKDHAPTSALQSQWRVDMANPFVHLELMANDVSKAKTFYGKLFDWKMEDTSDRKSVV